MPTTIVTATENLNRLATFRQAAYVALGQARDALFELGDAVLLTAHAKNAIAQILPEPQASLLTGILLGDDSGIPKSVQEDFRTTGTSHIVAISGYIGTQTESCN